MTSEQIITGALALYERPLISYAKENHRGLGIRARRGAGNLSPAQRQNVQALEPRLRPWLFPLCRNCAPRSFRNDREVQPGSGG
jgi:hypothetical protein